MGTINYQSPSNGRTRKNAFKKTPPRTASTDVLGMNKIFNPGYKPWMKIVWFIISTSCICLCLYQIGLRVTEFASAPLHLEMKIERQKSFIFPSVTVCSGALMFVIKEWVNALECEKYSTSCSTILKNATARANEYNDISETWNKYEMNLTMLRIGKPCPVFASDNEDCHKLTNASDVMNVEKLDTMWGRCLILTLKNKTMDFRGPFTWISIYWKDIFQYDTTAGGNLSLFYFVHEEGIHHMHDAPYIIDSIQIGYELHIRIAAKEYEALNTWNKPCVPEEEALRCFNDCIDKLMEKKLACGLPFIKSKHLRECTSIGETIEAFKKADEIYSSLKGGSCQCPRECHKIKYKTSVDYIEAIDTDKESDEVDDNVAKLVLSYGDETKEIITEKYAFAQSALFSEIGGSLGLYLGISIFTIVELLENLIRRAIHHFKSI